MTKTSNVSPSVPLAIIAGHVSEDGAEGTGGVTVEFEDESSPTPATIIRVANFTDNGSGDVSLYPGITGDGTAVIDFQTGGGNLIIHTSDSTVGVQLSETFQSLNLYADNLDARLLLKADQSYLEQAHTPGDLTDDGFEIAVGTDLLYLVFNEKDSSTYQIHAEAGAFDIELADDGSSVFRTVGTLGTFNLNDMGAKSRATAIVSPVAIANTETVVASLSMPTNSMRAGTTFRVKGYGRLTSGATPGTSIFRFRIGSTTLTGNIAATLSIVNATLVTNGSFVLDMLVTVRTDGSGGTAIGNISASGGSVSAFVGDVSAISSTVAVDTTATKLAEFTYISGNAGTTATFENVTIDMAQA